MKEQAAHNQDAQQKGGDRAIRRGTGVSDQLQACFLVHSHSGALLIDRFSALQGLALETQLGVLKGLSDSDRIVAVPDATMTDLV